MCLALSRNQSYGIVFMLKNKTLAKNAVTVQIRSFLELFADLEMRLTYFYLTGAFSVFPNNHHIAQPRGLVTGKSFLAKSSPKIIRRAESLFCSVVQVISIGADL